MRIAALQCRDSLLSTVILPRAQNCRRIWHFFKPYYYVQDTLKKAFFPISVLSSFHIFKIRIYDKINQFLLNLGMHIKFINHFALFYQAGVGKARLIIGKNIILFVKKLFCFYRADFYPATSNFENWKYLKFLLVYNIIIIFIRSGLYSKQRMAGRIIYNIHTVEDRSL